MPNTGVDIDAAIKPRRSRREPLVQELEIKKNMIKRTKIEGVMRGSYGKN